MLIGDVLPVVPRTSLTSGKEVGGMEWGYAGAAGECWAYFKEC